MYRVRRSPFFPDSKTSQDNQGCSKTGGSNYFFLPVPRFSKDRKGNPRQLGSKYWHGSGQVGEGGEKGAHPSPPALHYVGKNYLDRKRFGAVRLRVCEPRVLLSPPLSKNTLLVESKPTTRPNQSRKCSLLESMAFRTSELEPWPGAVLRSTC